MRLGKDIGHEEKHWRIFTLHSCPVSVEICYVTFCIVLKRSHPVIFLLEGYISACFDSDHSLTPCCIRPLEASPSRKHSMPICTQTDLIPMRIGPPKLMSEMKHGWKPHNEMSILCIADFQIKTTLHDFFRQIHPSLLGN